MCIDFNYVGGEILAFHGSRFVTGPVHLGLTLPYLEDNTAECVQG